MGVSDDIKERVNAIAGERSMQDNEAFGFWFLEDIEDLSSEEAEETVTGGPWDGGRDAVYYDEAQRNLRIYQMKYSDDRQYVLNAFSDLQRGLKAEYKDHPERFEDLEELNLLLVTTHTADDDFAATQKKQQQRIRTWLTNRGLGELSKRTQVEVFDLRKFAQLMEKLYGVTITADYRESPITSEDSLIGLIDARAFVKVIDKEELLAFNIRKFLGIRAGSVNSKIKETLESEDLRKSFWTFNNGIVCLCTNFSAVTETLYSFEDFTIVNGAQTISTIVSFLNDNATVLEDEPIWVVCKAIKVEPQDLGAAIKLTQTSNTQTPANGKDLRAVDQGHVRLEKWLSEFGVTYAFKRGGKAAKGADVVQMKDLAQAFVAYFEKAPNVAFSRVGSIFGKDEFYEKVFPSAEMEELYESGTKDEQLEFAAARLFPTRLLAAVRKYILERVKSGEGKKWKSLTYHIVFCYRILLDDREESARELLSKQEEIVKSSIDILFDGLVSLANTRKLEIPRSLKSDEFLEALEDSNWFDDYFGREARRGIEEVFTG